MTETRHKRGDVREDGMVFVGYRKDCASGERWVTPEKFAETRETENARRRSLRATDPDRRGKENARRRDRYAGSQELREKRSAYQRGRYASDPEIRTRIIAYNREYIRKRRAVDPLFATSLRLRARTSMAFNRIAVDKPAPTEELLGTDWQTLKAHIESQFVSGMSWENMSEWHIDHIVPLASANTEEELATLCHYTNLQPLWASDNIRKGAKLPHELNQTNE